MGGASSPLPLLLLLPPTTGSCSLSGRGEVGDLAAMIYYRIDIRYMRYGMR